MFFFSNILLIYTCLVFSLSISFIYANLSFLTTIHGINCSDFLHSLVWYLLPSFLTVFVALTFLLSLSHNILWPVFSSHSHLFFYSISCTLAFSISYSVFLSLYLLFASQSYLYSLLQYLPLCLCFGLSHNICYPIFYSLSIPLTVFAYQRFLHCLLLYLLHSVFFTFS